MAKKIVNNYDVKLDAIVESSDMVKDGLRVNTGASISKTKYY